LDRALELLTAHISKRGKGGLEEPVPNDAYLTARAEVTSLLVKKATAVATAAEADALLAEAKTRVEGEGAELADLPDTGVDPAVSAAVHRAAADYYKLRGPHHRFYSAALHYLSHVNVDALQPADRVTWAVDVAQAALVGNGVYNFGEVNAHPILKALAGTPHEWLVGLLGAFQNGDIDRFNAVVAANKAAFDAMPALASSVPAIREKITLLAVMELAARRPASARVITFDEVAAETQLPADNVEWLLMRALSLDLIRGSIDQVARSVSVSFVRPRVLDVAQVALLKDVVDGWRDKARATLTTLEDHLHGVFS
jgi:26S proteasome regulatory subunit N9